MNMLAETGGNKHVVEIVREDGHLVASVDGRKYKLEVSEPETGVFLFKKDGSIVEAFVSTRSNVADPTLVRIRNEVHEIRIIDPKRLRNAKGDDASASGKAEVKTAMPGKVVRILVSEGNSVQKGDGVIVVEAMKMQNEMKSPKDGTVTQIKTSEGATVSAGDVLVVIE